MGTVEHGEVKGRPRSGFITWLLLGTAGLVAVLALCDRQKSLEKLPPWDFMLERAVKVLVLAEGSDLLRTEAPGAKLIPGSEAAPLARLAAQADGEAFAKALRSEGFGAVVVQAGEAGAPGEAPAPRGSVLARLQAWHSGPSLTPLALRPDAAMYAPVAQRVIDDEVLALLVGAARVRLGGVGASATPDSQTRQAAAVRAGRSCGDTWCEVAISLSGLEPRDVKSKKANRIRKDVYVSGMGPTLMDATLAAAQALAKRWEAELAAQEGPIGKAMARLRIELHVMFSFALVDHEKADPGKDAFAAFLDRIVRPGLDGVALDWIPSTDGRPSVRQGYRFRLPTDAIYWSRESGTEVVQRLLKDSRVGGIEDLAKSHFSTLDRFSTIHVMEVEPGGRIARTSMGRLDVSPPGARDLLAGIARRLAADLGPDGLVALDYYPERDLDWPSGKDGEPSTIQQGLAAIALYTAADRLGDAGMRASADRATGFMLGWVRLCPGLDPGEPGKKGEAARDAWKGRMLESCGPIDTSGRVFPAGQWSNGYGETIAVPMDLALVVHRSEATVEAAALVLDAVSWRLQTSGAESPAPGLAEVAAGLARFLLMMQRPDGSFDARFAATGAKQSGQADVRTAALAIVALARSSAIVDDARIAPAVAKGLAALASPVSVLVAQSGAASGKGCSPLAQLVPWLDLAWAEAARAGWGSPEAAQAVGDGADALAGACLVGPAEALDPALAGAYAPPAQAPWAIPGASDLLVAASQQRLCSSSNGGHTNREEHADAASLGVALAVRLAVVPGMGDHFFPVPGHASWGVGEDLLHHVQRAEHAFAAITLLDLALSR